MEMDWPCLSGRITQGFPARCRHEGCRPAPLPTAVRPPEPPRGRTAVGRLPDADQFIRAEALRAATSGGLRDPEAAIRDAKRYAEWIKNG